MTDPIETGREVVAYIKSVIGNGGALIRSDDPSVALSTSAQLRETQAALAASQADLTAMERERDEANELTDGIDKQLRLATRERDSLARRCAVRFEETQALQADLTAMERRLLERTTEVVELTRERDGVREELARVERERDQACALSVELLREDERLRERDLASAELTSARAELEQLRRELGWQTGNHTQDTPGTPVPRHHEGDTP